MDKVVEEVLAGKKGAASRFYRLYADKLRNYLAIKLPSEEAAEEILQDVFLSAFDNLPLYRGEAKESTWLMAIARHEEADYYRKRYVRAAVEKTSPLWEDLLEKSETPELVWQKKKMRRRFLRAYRAISSQYQEILSWRFEMGMSVREIAERMKLPFKATESLLYRARKAFAVAYAKEN